MKPVRAALGHHVDHAARREPELGRHNVRLHLEFLDGVHCGIDIQIGEKGVVVIASVDQHAIQRARTTVNADRGELDAAVGKAGVERAALRFHARREQHQCEHVPAVERQIGDAPVLHHFPDRGARGIHKSGLPTDFDRFGRRAHLQLEVDVRVLIHLQRQARAHFFLESLFFHRHRIHSDRKRRNRVEAGFIGHGGECGVGCGVDDGDRRFGHGGPGPVRHCPGDGASALLRLRRNGRQDSHRDCETDPFHRDPQPDLQAIYHLRCGCQVHCSTRVRWPGSGWPERFKFCNLRKRGQPISQKRL